MSGLFGISRSHIIGHHYIMNTNSKSTRWPMWGRALNRRPLIEVNIESSLRVLFETNTPQT